MSASKPIVRLLSTGITPFDDIISSARTCYSGKGIVLPHDVASGDDEAKGRQMGILKSIYQAGHHTTFQHSYLHFALENTSRAVIWSFLHAHPFYNSEQVSQRYVKVKRDQFFIPEGLSPSQEEFLLATYDLQIRAYKKLGKALEAVASEEYVTRFKARAGSERMKKDIQKKTQEIARYVLPLGTTAYLHHTISFLTLLRYYRMCRLGDVPAEQVALVHAMMEEVKKLDPSIEDYLQKTLEDEEIGLEAQVELNREKALQFCEHFDARLKGKVSALVDYKASQVEALADSVREVLGQLPQDLSDEDALAILMDSGRNPLFKESLNVSTHSKIMRSAMHASYTFRKKLSHAADSQDQRHRMTPGSRPFLKAHYTGKPDYVIPRLFELDSEAKALYSKTMEEIWQRCEEALELGFSYEQMHYMLPNALSVRFSESGDLLAMKHKMAMRLCYNAQEEIWQASLDEALQISEVHPQIGQYLLPPCTIRKAAATRPICPEGDRFCGVPVWRLKREDYHRAI